MGLVIWLLAALFSVVPAISTSRAVLAAESGRIAFAGVDRHLWLLDQVTGSGGRLTNTANERVHSPRWSPDGARIAYLSSAREPGEFGPGRPDDIFIINASGGTPIRVTSLREPLHDLSWFPDGQTLLFGTGFNGGFKVNTVSAQGGEIITLPVPTDADQLSLSVSPDGQWIAFAESKLVGGAFSQALVIASRDGAQRRTLRDFGTESDPYLIPTWNPQEPSIAFPQGGKALQIGLTPGEPVVIADATRQIVSGVSFSPNASTLAFAAWLPAPGSQRGGPAALWISRRDGSEPIVIPSIGDATRTRIVWAENETRLYFQATTALISGARSIYSVKSDGSELTPLTEATSDFDDVFDWIP